MDQTTSERKTYRYEAMTCRDGSPSLNFTHGDLRAELLTDTDQERYGYVITIYDETGTYQQAETAEALYYPGAGRLGIAWGADATWADVDDLESGIEMWLNDNEAWEQRN